MLRGGRDPPARGGGLAVPLLRGVGALGGNFLGRLLGAGTGVVDRMERAGYVRREKDPADGRRVIVRPVVEKLERAGANFFGSMEGEMDALLSEYDDEDLAVFLDLMRKANAMTEQQIADRK